MVLTHLGDSRCSVTHVVRLWGAEICLFCGTHMEQAGLLLCELEFG